MVSGPPRPLCYAAPHPSVLQLEGTQLQRDPRIHQAYSHHPQQGLSMPQQGYNTPGSRFVGGCRGSEGQLLLLGMGGF